LKSNEAGELTARIEIIAQGSHMVGPDRDYEIRLIPDIFDPPPVAMDLEKNRFIERLHPKAWLNAAREHRYAAEIIFKHEQPFWGHHTRQPKHAGALLLYGFAFVRIMTL
jgi:hypothetical protein